MTPCECARIKSDDRERDSALRQLDYVPITGSLEICS
jgi:hypothetical protein